MFVEMLRFPAFAPAIARAIALAIAILVTLPAPSPGELLRVGTGGDFATIQAALDVAQGNFESDEIRVRTGTYDETLELFFVQPGDAIEVSGGWDAAFAVRDPDPSLTVVDADGLAGRAFHAIVGSAGLTLRGLTFTNGFFSLAGAGALVIVTGTGVARIEACRIVGNTVSSADPIQGAAGGGLNASAKDDGLLVLRDVEISQNLTTLTGASGVSRGAGAQISSSENAHVELWRLRVVANQAAGGATRAGAGLLLNLQGASTLLFADSLVAGNFGSTLSISSGFDLRLLDSAAAVITRLEVSDNRLDSEDASPQARFRIFGPGTGSIRFSDSWIVGGGTGVVGDADVGTLRFTHLTVAYHTGTGATASAAPGATASTANSVFWENDIADLTGNGSSTANLVGTDPLFVDAGNGDFRLTAGSPARNTGSAAPPGGLSLYDAAHAPRVAGPSPDRGAFEHDALFGDDFESGDTGSWSE